MNTETQQHEVRIQIEDSRRIYIGPSAIAAIQTEAWQQMDDRLGEAYTAWRVLVDANDFEGLKAVRDYLSSAQDALDALVCLAPVPEYDSDDA